MSLEIPTDAASTSAELQPAPAITYIVTETEDGDLETGVVLLDGRSIGRLSHRPSVGPIPRRPFESSLAGDPVWHAAAIGWIPHDGRPWDSRVTSSAPTRRRAVEDLLRAYRNHR